MAARGALVVVVVLVVLGVLGAALASEGDGEGTSFGSRQPPRPVPRVDRDAGPPAYLAAFGERRALLLDAHGRVARRLPRGIGPPDAVCPGGRRLVDGVAWDGRVHVRDLRGRTIWQRRHPFSEHAQLACLDPSGRRVAVLADHETRDLTTLRIVTRHGSRVVLRTRPPVPELTRTHAYASTASGLTVHAVADGREVGSYGGPKWPHTILPSPDGRRLATSQLDEVDPLDADDSFLVETDTGAVRPIELPDLTLLGWVDASLLAVRAGGHLRLLDPELRERLDAGRFRPQSALITPSGDLVASDGRALLALRNGARSVERIGTVPKGVHLVAALR
jgi:hypothetical protein